MYLSVINVSRKELKEKAYLMNEMESDETDRFSLFNKLIVQFFALPPGVFERVKRNFNGDQFEPSERDEIEQNCLITSLPLVWQAKIILIVKIKLK